MNILKIRSGNISKKIEILINIFKNISNNIQDKIFIKFSNILIRLTFLKKDIRIKLSSYESIKNLSDDDIKKFKLGHDKGYLALYLINKMNIKEKNILRKLSFLISYSRYKHCSLDLLIKNLDEINFNLQELKDMFFFLPSPFAVYGDYERFERIHKYLKKRLDIFLKRKAGIHNESAYLTAIGHMCHFVYLLKAIDIGFINKKKVSIDIVKAKEGPANNEYFKLVNSKCKELGIEIKKENSSYSAFEPDLDSWPMENNTYIFGRHIFGHIDYYWELQNKKNNFLIPSKYQLETAKRILLKHYGKIPINFVGMHFRVSKDNQSIRNITEQTAKYAVEEILSNKLDCFLIGTKKLFEKKNNSLYKFLKYKNLFDTTRLGLSKFERECLQIYIWSHSRFFIGSKSGGTNPPGTFGTPTIWLDTHPTVDARPPYRYDHIIPKKIFSLSKNKFLELNELFKAENIASQSTDKNFLKKNGFRIESCERNNIKKSIKEMIKQTSTQNSQKKDYKNFEILNNDIFNIKENFNKFKYGGKYFV